MLSLILCSYMILSRTTSFFRAVFFLRDKYYINVRGKRAHTIHKNMFEILRDLVLRGQLTLSLKLFVGLSYFRASLEDRHAARYFDRLPPWAHMIFEESGDCLEGVHFRQFLSLFSPAVRFFTFYNLRISRYTLPSSRSFTIRSTSAICAMLISSFCPYHTLIPLRP